MKAGWKTSEFWVSLATAAGGLLVAFGFIGPESEEVIIQAVGQMAGAIIAGLSALGYAHSRGTAKSGTDHSTG